MKDAIRKLVNRFYEYAYSRAWAWALVRFVVFPIDCALHVILNHVPEYIADLRAGMAELEADRAKDLGPK